MYKYVGLFVHLLWELKSHGIVVDVELTKNLNLENINDSYKPHVHVLIAVIFVYFLIITKLFNMYTRRGIFCWSMKISQKEKF